VGFTEVELPDIQKSHLKNLCQSNINGIKYKFFQFKLYNYIYNSAQICLDSIKFNIKTCQENIHKIFTKGLNEDELIYQTKIFGKSDLDIKIESIFALIIKEVTDPFYIFQVFSVTLWMLNDYVQYAVIIIITTLISLIFTVYETRVNLVNIQKMAKYSCKVNVFRQIEVFLNK
jgi:cation-transporting ATPase 13A3/4/5